MYVQLCSLGSFSIIHLIMRRTHDINDTNLSFRSCVQNLFWRDSIFETRIFPKANSTLARAKPYHKGIKWRSLTEMQLIL